MRFDYGGIAASVFHPSFPSTVWKFLFSFWLSEKDWWWLNGGKSKKDYYRSKTRNLEFCDIGIFSESFSREFKDWKIEIFFFLKILIILMTSRNRIRIKVSKFEDPNFNKNVFDFFDFTKIFPRLHTPRLNFSFHKFTVQKYLKNRAIFTPSYTVSP